MNHPLANPNCPDCNGRGKIKVPMKNKPPKERLCQCTYIGQMNRKLENTWQGLSKISPIQESPLLEYIDKRVWLTAEPTWLMSNLRHLVTRQPLEWKVKVITDKELMAAWLATAALAGVDILDKEAFEVTTYKLSIEDLVQPYDLVILRLGVKMARNSAMPEVLMEALALREHLEKATWVWDQPTRSLGEGHRCWSLEVQDELSRYERVKNTRSAAFSTAPKKQRTFEVSDVGTVQTPSSKRKVRGVRTLSQDMRRK